MKGAWICVFAIACGAHAQDRPKAKGPLTIDDAINLAMRYSPVVASADAGILEARGQTRSARARTQPQMSLNGFGGLGDNGHIVQSSAGVSPANLFVHSPSAFSDVNLTLMVPLFTGGVLQGLAAAALHNERATTGDALEVRADVALAVAKAYLELLDTFEVSAERATRIVSQKELARSTRVGFDAGKEIYASVASADAEVALAQKRYATAVSDTEKAVIELNATMGTDLAVRPQLADRLDVRGKALPLEEYIKQSATRRGVLIAATERVRQAESALRAAVGSTGPQVYGVAMGDLSTDRTASRGGLLGVTIGIPILDAGERRGTITSARAALARAKADLAAKQIQVEKEIRQAYSDATTTGANIKLAQSAVDAAILSNQTVSARVVNGKGTLLDLQVSLESLSTAKSDLAEADFEYRFSLYRLDRAAGLLPHPVVSTEKVSR